MTCPRFASQHFRQLAYRPRLDHKSVGTLARLKTCSLQQQHQPYHIQQRRPTNIPVTWRYTPPSDSIRTRTTMASATSFYDFKPLDSMCLIPMRAPIKLSTNTWIRAWPGGPHRRLQGQGRPHCQHGLQVRFHTAIRGPREALQVRQGEARR